jgi:hypothetical protein
VRGSSRHRSPSIVTLLHPDCEPWIAHSDIRQARALASLICSSESAIDAYLLFGLAEAKALIVQHRAAVLAIANALMIHGTLDAAQIDTSIAAAPERARRTAWGRVAENATNFTQSDGAVSRYGTGPTESLEMKADPHDRQSRSQHRVFGRAGRSQYCKTSSKDRRYGRQ